MISFIDIAIALIVPTIVEITDASKYLKTISGKTYVDLSTFAPDAKIEIEYTTNN